MFLLPRTRRFLELNVPASENGSAEPFLKRGHTATESVQQAEQTRMHIATMGDMARSVTSLYSPSNPRPPQGKDEPVAIAEFRIIFFNRFDHKLRLRTGRTRTQSKIPASVHQCLPAC